MSDQQAPMVSHGRGGTSLNPTFIGEVPQSLTSHLGAANITHDSTEYVDGSIHREGMAGDQGDGPFSTGVSTSSQILLIPSVFDPKSKSQR